MKSRGLWLIGAAMLVGVVAGDTAPRLWRWWSSPPPGYCPICRRHEHADSVVKLQAQGEEVIDACCLGCALSYGRQTAKPVKIISVTDHETRRPLDPDTATFVVGSDASPCTHTSEQLRLEEEAVPVHWDRCLPSILAFASTDSAQAFQAEHGGRLRSLQQLRVETATAKDPAD
jgi:hypothetical protein